jgi:hypothetical protein
MTRRFGLERVLPSQQRAAERVPNWLVLSKLNATPSGTETIVRSADVGSAEARVRVGYRFEDEGSGSIQLSAGAAGRSIEFAACLFGSLPLTD